MGLRSRLILALLTALCFNAFALGAGASAAPLHVARAGDLDPSCARPSRAASAPARDGDLWVVCAGAHGDPALLVLPLHGRMRHVALTGLDARARRWFSARDLTWASDDALWLHDGGGTVIRIDRSHHVRVRRLPGVARTGGLVAGRDGSVWIATSASPDATAGRAVVQLAPGGGLRTHPIASGSGAIVPDLLAAADGGVWVRDGAARVTHVAPDGATVSATLPFAGRPQGATADGGVVWGRSAEIVRVSAAGVVGAAAPLSVRQVHGTAQLLPYGGPFSLCFPIGSTVCRLDPDAGVLNALTLPARFGYVASGPTTGPGGGLWFASSKGLLVRVRFDGEVRSYGLRSLAGGASELLGASGGAVWLASRDRAVFRVTTF
jgi:hypothetical protein